MPPWPGNRRTGSAHVSAQSSVVAPAKPLMAYRPFWAKRLGRAPFLPMSRAEMDLLGWDSCDVIVVTGDAYVDHPSFGMAVIGRVLEAQGFRVGIIAQPDWLHRGPQDPQRRRLHARRRRRQAARPRHPGLHATLQRSL